jgi:hypothetical protein
MREAAEIIAPKGRGVRERIQSWWTSSRVDKLSCGRVYVMAGMLVGTCGINSQSISAAGSSSAVNLMADWIASVVVVTR